MVVIAADDLRELIRGEVRRLLEQWAPREPEWIDTAEAAKILGEHPKTTARRARNGDIPARRLGNQWRFRRADLDKRLEVAE